MSLVQTILKKAEQTIMIIFKNKRKLSENKSEKKGQTNNESKRPNGRSSGTVVQTQLLDSWMIDEAKHITVLTVQTN